MMKYFLQVTDVLDVFRQIIGGAPTELSSILVGLALPLLLVTIAGIVGFFIYRAIRDKFDYIGVGARLGNFKIDIMGKYPLEGNLSANDDWGIAPDLTNFENQNIRDAVMKVFEMIRSGQLYAYYLKITDDTDMWDKFRKSDTKKTVLISTGKLESDDFSWLDQKGVRTITSVFQKEYPRRVVAYHTSQRLEITNEDGDLDEYWIINPIPKSSLNTVDPITGSSMAINVNQVADAKGIATVGSFMASLNEALSKKKQYELHIDHYNKIIEDKDTELMKRNSKIQKLRYDLTQKPYIIYGTDQKRLPPKSELVWLFIFWLAGMAGYAVIPEIPQLAGKVDPLLASVAGVIIALVARSLLQKKDKYDESDEESTA